MERNGRSERVNFFAQRQIETRRYMPGLDGLRALAVLAVIAYHLNLPWAPGGLLGVCIFFVLSGYLITDILVNQWQSNGKINLKEFWLARARRLLPALFVMLGGVIGWLSFFEPERLSSLWNDVVAALFYFSNWQLIFQQVSYFASFGPPSPFVHLWSLAVEEQFYLLWPLLLGLGLCFIPQRRRLIGMIMALALVSAAAMAIIYQPGLDPSRVYYGTDTRAFALLIGAAMAMVWPSRKLSTELSLRHRILLDATGGTALLVVLLMIWQSNQYQTSLYYGGMLGFSLISAVLVAVLAHPASYLGRILGMQPLRWLGVCSYGIYLWHYPVIVLTSPGINTGGVSVALAVAQTALCIILAAASWHFIEAPIRHRGWKKYPQPLPYVSNWRPGLIGSQGKATVTSIVLILFVFVSVVSGCSLISHAKQQSSPPRMLDKIDRAEEPGQIGNTDQADKTGQSIKTELISQPAGGTTQADKDQEIGNQASSGVNQPEPNQKHMLSGQGITAIGDSVMVEVGPALQKLYPDIVVDGKIGRQMYQAAQVIRNHQDQGTLGHTVIIELGANGAFTEKQFADILELLGSDHQIVLINTRVPRPWESVVNLLLGQAAEDHQNIKLVDWYSASSGHDEYFYTDGVHLQEAGVQAYATLVAEALAPRD